MKFFIMRHGNSDMESQDDATRSLTISGIKESRKIAHWLINHRIHIEQILVSPYKRSLHTLLTMKDILNIKKYNVLDNLVPNGDHTLFYQYLKKMATYEVKSVLLISHLPFICNLFKVVCPKEKLITFATASVACIEYYIIKNECQFLWYKSPSVIKCT
ncbi:phosphohistidine phosphatase SixA [Candidatus Pantoea edessiphila]|uniref:Phosphohistidine phosphatase SixA n=1 Tax=Candidatus Pantoea edessiphila TaxID=2044610 RepID=A0A2P5T0X1_9GAMM|nr:phosphohistidine phosphatase SixA [Candidatus Pantoea edessiphila]PPI88239.1 phosphohistidine phosphatase SixA [Candidatus Pantoea edessiphila]